LESAPHRGAEARTPARPLCKRAQERFHHTTDCKTTFECSPNDIGPVGRQLQEIAAAFRALPAALDGTTEDGVGAESLYDCFRNANGENLFECLLELCAVAIEHERPIIFV
jgi:hypothetical protein